MRRVSRDVEITILNRKYVLRSEDDEENLREVARFVDERLTEVGRAMAAPPTTVAVLGALNIANEYFEYRRKMDRLLEELEAQSDEALAALDEELA